MFGMGWGRWGEEEWPVSFLQALVWCAHHCADLFYFPPVWWEHLDRNVSLLASTSQEYSLQAGEGKDAVMSNIISFNNHEWFDNKKNLQHRIRPYLNCQGCLQRSTWEWRQCPGKTGASACRNLPDLQYPKVQALPGEGKEKFIISTD